MRAGDLASQGYSIRQDKGPTKVDVHGLDTCRRVWERLVVRTWIRMVTGFSFVGCAERAGNGDLGIEMTEVDVGIEGRLVGKHTG